MPLFRLIRRELDESLKTTIIVKNEQELREAILKNWERWLDHPRAPEANFHGFTIKITRPDLEIEKCFDDRCGWYQHYVIADVLRKDKFCLEGFLSEPMSENIFTGADLTIAYKKTLKQQLYCPYADCVVQKFQHNHLDENTITFL